MRHATNHPAGAPWRQAATALLAVITIGLLLKALVPTASAAAPADPKPAAAPPPHLVEWVYRVRLGHEAEFWRIFQRTQIPVLDREKQEGSVLDYAVYKPGLHVAGAARWSYRIVITYRDVTSPSRAGAIERALFPDRAAYERDEIRRWDLVEDHYDLPIHTADPHADP